MKKKLLLIIGIIFTIIVSSQKTIPNITLKSLENKNVSTFDLNNNNELYVICFFAIWCKPCRVELNAIADIIDEWKEKSNIKIIAISIDDSKSYSKVKSLVYGNDWPFEVYLDQNSDLKRALNINYIPHVLIVNSKHEILWEKSSYTPGSEDIILKQYLKLNK